MPRAEFVRSAYTADDFVSDDRPEVAFVGRSNVGKSSVLNRLLNRKKLARVSSTPGRTQCVNYFLVDDRLWFVDLPGYGYAKTSKKKRRSWARLMEEYFERSLPEALVVLLVDAKVRGTALDVQAYDYMLAMGADPVVVATKIDKVPRSRRHSSEKEMRDRLVLHEEQTVVPFSATTGEGARELWREIHSRL